MICFKPIVYDGFSSNVKVYRKNVAKVTYDSVKNFFSHEINPDIQFIFAGDGKSLIRNEQWTDGCNLVAIKPGVAMGYDQKPLKLILHYAMQDIPSFMQEIFCVMLKIKPLMSIR